MAEGGNSTGSSLIVSLLRSPFCDRTLVQRDAIVAAGRPTPKVKTLRPFRRSNEFTYTCHFRIAWYSVHSWLTGCTITNKVYCWPCLLMSHKKLLWNKRGFYDYSNLSNSTVKHAKSKDHLHSQLALKRWEGALAAKRKKILVADNTLALKEEFNANVRMNKELLKELIDFTSLLCGQNTIFGVHDEGEPSLITGNFEDAFLSYVRQNNELSGHCKKLGYNFFGSVESDILECIEEELTNFIRNEINETPFFSIQIDDVTDLSNKSQCSIIVRFVDTEGNIQERFYGFHEVGSMKTAVGMRAVLDRVFDKSSLCKRLVAVSCDGASVKTKELQIFKELIKSAAPQSMFVHFAATQRLDDILEQSATCSIKETRELFATMRGLPKFFRRFAKMSEALKRILEDHIPSHVELRWNSNSKLFTFVLEHGEKLVAIFNDLIEATDSSSSIKREACGFKAVLSRFQNLFLLIVYNDIFLKTDYLNKTLHIRVTDVDYCLKVVAQVVASFKQSRTEEHVQTFLTEAELRFGLQHSSDHDDESFGKIGSKYSTIYFNIIDNVLLLLETRLMDVQQLRPLELVDNSKFLNYTTTFPINALLSLKNSYKNRFDFDRLGNELHVLYSDLDFHERSVAFTMKLMVISELTDIFQEAYKLYTLAGTLPVTVPPQERNFPCLDKVKRYLRTWNGSPSRTATSFIESRLLSHIKTKKTWHEGVTKRFALKNNKLDLQYKP